MRRGKHLLAKLAIVLPGETGWKDVADTNDWRAVDRARLTAGWGRGWKLDDGGTAQFRYEMRPNGPGKVALGYDAGAEDAVIAAQKGKSGFQLQFTVPKGVAFRADKGSPALELEPDDPERHVTISLARAPGWTAEGKDGSTIVIWWVSSRRGEIAFDFHESSAPKLKPTPQQGEIDFWTTDALHVPVKPGRNRVTNGSFEQGLVGWWYAGYQWDGWSVAQMKKLGDAPQRIVVDGGVHGRKSLRYRVNGNGLVEGFRSLPMALKAGRVHTLSIWARGEPERDAVTLGVHPRAVGEQSKVKASELVSKF